MNKCLQCQREGTKPITDNEGSVYGLLCQQHAKELNRWLVQNMNLGTTNLKFPRRRFAIEMWNYENVIIRKG